MSKMVSLFFGPALSGRLIRIHSACGPMRGPKLFIAAALAAGLLGCQVYRPQPLTADAVDRALVPPQAAQLKVQADALKHPLLPPVTVDLADGLSPDEAAVVAVLVNPSLRSVRDGRALSDAQLLQAGLLPNPELALGFAAPTAGVTAGTVNAYTLGLDWEVTGLVGRRAGIEAARASRAAVDLDVAWQEWQVAQAARLAVYALLRPSGTGRAGDRDGPPAGRQPGPGLPGRARRA